MNRNVESHFSEVPGIDIERSVFDRSSTHKTSLQVGRLIPFYIDEVLPGDTFRVTTSKVVRLQTMLTPVMDNLYLDTYYFFVPNRLVWNHWKEFCGENTESAWVQQTEYQIPTISAPEGGFQTGTIADYLGLPVGVNWTNSAKRRPSALPFRAYALICDQWFRDENLTDPLNIPLGDANQTGSNGDNYIDDVANGGMPFRVAKYHDYFTSMLPSPLKASEPVTMNAAPIISINAGGLPVYSGDNVPSSLYPMQGLKLGSPSNGSVGSTRRILTSSNGVMSDGATNSDSFNSPQTAINLWADGSGISGTATGVSFTINELRLAFQLQRFYERNARSGSRYIEFLKAHFSVTSPDSRLQRTEYLGGNRVPVQVHEVTNTAQGEQDFLGDLGAMSVTSDIHEDFEQSFTEHGLVIGVCCLRYDHSYTGLEKFWTRRKITDFYLPVFANLGEQPAFKSEIFASDATMDSDDVFGYQEAWAEYRYKPDRVSGEMRPGVANTLASWNYADYYTEPPTLSDAWIREDPSNVDRTLAVTSSLAHVAWMDCYIKNICTRPMPMYSIPGLIDHH